MASDNIDRGTPGRQALPSMRIAAVLLALAPAVLPGQGTAATTYLERFREIKNLRPLPGRVAAVDHLVLNRDAARLALERGALYLLSPVGGRTMAAVFQGQGRFTLVPPDPAEQAQLQRLAGAPALDEAISEAVLLFADSTLGQFGALSFGDAEVPGSVADHMRDLIGSLEGDKEGSLSSDVMGPLLNAEPSGFFLARVDRANGGNLLFQFNPNVNESVQLYRPVGHMRWGTNWAVITQFPPRQAASGASSAWWYRDRLRVPQYRMEISLTPTGSGDLDFRASATLALSAVESEGPWLLFGIHPVLELDSARWEGPDGGPAVAFKAKDSGDLWVRAKRRLAPGDSATLTLFYHGDLIDRYGDWFYVDPLADWYPVNRQGRNIAAFDLTYHSPSWYPIASIGDRVDSTVDGRVMTTRWIARVPTPYASFNLGLFESYHVQHEGAPPLDVLLSEDAHRQLQRDLLREGILIPQQSHMRENVAADVSNSLKLFAHLFGDSFYEHFFVTEIPYNEGVSFPGLIHLSWATFQTTTLDGFDEFFRAHEVAHQWWGNGVRPASYRDAWLSEGLASFSGLWYVQHLRKRTDEYFKFLDRYKADIDDYRREAGPIWIGYRNATPSARRGYDVTIYEKGAWVFHMLRILMLDLGTMKEDRFIETLRDFYQSYRGHPATTDDFRRLVERHAGVPMDWFFDQWVKGTAIPTYHVAWTGEPADAGKYRVRLRITQENVPADFQMFVLVSADLGNNRFAHFRIGVNGGQTEYVSPLLPSPPKGIHFNELHSVLADVKMERWP